MMKHLSTTPSIQHLGHGESLHLHVNAGDELQIILGEARIEQQLWIAEHMLMQRSLLAAGQLHRCDDKGWVSLTSLSALEFTHSESTPWPATMRHAMQGLSQLRTWLAQLIHRKTHHAQ
jgi:hypothetical protein